MNRGLMKSEWAALQGCMHYWKKRDINKVPDDYYGTKDPKLYPSYMAMTILKLLFSKYIKV